MVTARRVPRAATGKDRRGYLDHSRQALVVGLAVRLRIGESLRDRQLDRLP
jgi:hypothetical protein